MNKFQRTIVTATATGALLAQAVLPAFAVDLIITGNGDSANSNINFTNTNTTIVDQDNQTEVDNKIVVNADTGNNTASGNTGGDVHIETGDADVYVTVDNVLNSNVAEVESCGSCLGDASILIDGNGTETNNTANLGLSNSVILGQTNVADIDNKVEIDADTGSNRADDNTGGDVVVLTGDVWVDAIVSTVANANTASVGGSDGEEGGSVGVAIIGNGSNSNNTAGLNLAQLTAVTQQNWTEIENDLGITGNSGANVVDDNTGGNDAVSTGNVDIFVDVFNEAGFNYFDDGECCIEDVMAKIGENGTETDNNLHAALNNTSTTTQDNFCGEDDCFDNDLTLDGTTGGNRTNDNTGDSESDPITLTGNAYIDVSVFNEGGSNVIGAPEAPAAGLQTDSGLDVTITLDLSGLLASLGLI